MSRRTSSRFSWIRRTWRWLSSFAFASKSVYTADWRAARKSADDEILADLATSTPRARQMVRDTWIGRSTLSAYLRHAVGSGISLRSSARDPNSNQRLPAGDWLTFVRQVDRLWRRWMRNARLVDAEGNRSLLQIQRFGIREWATVGEAFAVLGYERRAEDVGLTVRVFEQEQLASDLSVSPASGNEIRGGVEIDRNGRRIAYHVYRGGHPLEGGPLEIERIPAGRVLLFADPERARQTHGMTPFHAVGIKARHVHYYDEYETIAKRAEAAICAVRKRGSSGQTFTGLAHPMGDTGLDTDGNEITELRPGVIVDVGQDGSLDLLNPQRPGAAYEPFMRIQLAEVAAGLDMDPAMLLRDFSRANFSGQRQSLLEFWAVTDVLQELLVEQWLRPIWEAFVALAVSEGFAQPPAGYFEDAEVRAACLEMDWQPPPKYWIDPARQAAAVKLGLDSYQTTPGRELEKVGYTFQGTIDEWAEQIEYARARGIDIRPSAQGQSPYEPRPGSRAGGDRSGQEGTEDGEIVPTQSRRPGGNGDRFRLPDWDIEEDG